MESSSNMLTSWHPCAILSLLQVMIHQLLDKWGVEGLESFVRGLQKRYAHYAAVAAAAAEEHLDGLVEWTPAKAGMFMWMKMLGE